MRSHTAGISRSDEVVQLFLKDAGRVYLHQGEAGEAGRTRVPRRAMSEEKRARSERQGHEPARRERGRMPATRGANYTPMDLTDGFRLLDTPPPGRMAGGASLRDVRAAPAAARQGRGRYFYSPYGQLEAVISSHPFDFDDDGDVDEDDSEAVMECFGGGGGYSGDCRRLDADGNRELDYDDFEIVDDYATGLSGDTTWTRVPSSPRSRLGNPFAHQGLPLDAEIASYQNRARQYNPGLKRFMQRDPLATQPRAGRGYQDGMNLFLRARANPWRTFDPSGTQCTLSQAYEACGEALVKAIGQNPGLVPEGLTICCNGTPTICPIPVDPPPWSGPWGAGFQDCIREHERSHLLNCDCSTPPPEGYLCWQACFFPDSASRDTAECVAYSIEVECLKGKREDYCTFDNFPSFEELTRCYSEFDSRIADKCNIAQGKCSNGGMPCLADCPPP